ncbi:Major facilitator superfamily protein [Theobroma cacao]|uniref:Major facilitator superfamily protein n=1 Tax=Theobroma cacao TaxID=3641 RepID=A0A061FKX2_THECC|nr:Major facilitator superfamily protein [Theobroma cacao]
MGQTWCHEEGSLAPAEAHGFINCQGNPVYRSKSSGWKSACFIIGVEVAESHLAAFVADSFLGRYCTITLASLIYTLVSPLLSSVSCMFKGSATKPNTLLSSCHMLCIVEADSSATSKARGLGLLTLAAMLPSLKTSGCSNTKKITPCSPPQLQVILLFFSLYLVAVGQARHKPCVQALGADQFDGEDIEESKAKSSFFNWCWGLAFGIPYIVMVLAVAIFLLGSKNYRYRIKGHKRSPFVRIGRVFDRAIRNWRASPSSTTFEEGAHSNLPVQISNHFE